MSQAISQKNLSQQFVIDYFAEEKNISLQPSQVESIAKVAFKTFRYDEKVPYSFKAKDLCVEHQKEFNAAIKKVIVSASSPWQPQCETASKNQELFFNLIRGIVPPLGEIAKSPTLLKAVIWKKDSEVLGEAKALLQIIFEDIYAGMPEEFSLEDSFHYEAIVGDLLALLPFLRPESGTTFKIPIQINNVWELAEYTIEEISLTSKWLGSPCTAYGLKPKEDQVPPLLLYKGTTYPTDKGFLLSLLTDINPLSSVGNYIFKLCRKKVSKWLDVQTSHGQIKARVFGKSLGGALAWHTAIEFPNLIEKAIACSAPGFSSSSIKKIKKHNEALPEINFLSQTNDLVPYCDKVVEHKNIHYYEVISGANRAGLRAHAFMYSTHESTSIVRDTQIKENHPWIRKSISFIHGVISLVVFPIFLSLYIVYNTAHQATKLILKPIKKLTHTAFHYTNALFVRLLVFK